VFLVMEAIFTLPLNHRERLCFAGSQLTLIQLNKKQQNTIVYFICSINKDEKEKI